MNTLIICIALCVGLAVGFAFGCLFASVDRDDFDEVQDDPRPGEVLRAAWADRETLESVSPITGRPITIRNHADLSAAVAARHSLGDVARIGWQTRRAGK